jgi:hypothetical protein
VITAGGTLKEGRFSRLNVGQVDQALAAALPDEVPESFQQRLVDLWPSHKDQLMRSLEVRMDDHTNGLQKALEDRCEKEVANITAILTELRQQILHELEDSGEKQLELFREFSNPEKEQFERNLSSLQLRVEQIPQEIEQETAIIRARFSDPTPRLFPLAVTYLVPHKLIQW